jgi:hypothetical protein
MVEQVIGEYQAVLAEQPLMLFYRMDNQVREAAEVFQVHLQPPMAAKAATEFQEEAEAVIQ